MAPPIRHSISTPSTKAASRSRPLTGRSSASANSAGATGAVGWIAVGTWVSSKSSTLALAAFRKAALSASTRSPRPMTADLLAAGKRGEQLQGDLDRAAVAARQRHREEVHERALGLVRDVRRNLAPAGVDDEAGEVLGDVGSVQHGGS